MTQYKTLKQERDEAVARAVEAERLSNVEVVRELEAKLEKERILRRRTLLQIRIFAGSANTQLQRWFPDLESVLHENVIEVFRKVIDSLDKIEKTAIDNKDAEEGECPSTSHS